MKILLAMDTSPASQTALEGILARQWPAESSFDVLSVVEPSHLWTAAEAVQEAARRAEETVGRAVERLRAKGWEADGSAISGDPKAILLERAREMEADFVVVGPHGTSGVAKFLLGSVAQTVLRHAPCSVAVMRAKAGGPVDFQVRRILLATDGSKFSELAARSIAGRPWAAGTEVRILTAVELILPASRAFLEPPFVDSAFLEIAREEAMKRAQQAIASAREILSAAAGLEVSESISVLLETAKTIVLDEAAQWGADLIVLGSHGSRGMDRFLLGSVSETAALHAHCPVEVIRKRGAR